MICPDCGEPMKSGDAFLNTGRTCLRLPLAPYCVSDECRTRRVLAAEARTEALIARAIAAGIIDP